MPEPASCTRKMLNVGGNNKTFPIPDHYRNYQHTMLDIDPRCEPDIICDARELLTLTSATYDSVYCSHNLEHNYRHEVPVVLKGFYHVLKEDGFVEIHVPDLDQLMRRVVEKHLDLDSFLYQSSAGPVTVQDVIYGYAPVIEQSQNNYFAHKTGFTPKSLSKILKDSGFTHVYTTTTDLEIIALAFKAAPDQFHRELLNITEA